MPSKLSKISDSFCAEAIQQWLSSNHCVYVGNAPCPQTFISRPKEGPGSHVHLESGKNEDGNWLFGLKHLDWDSRHFGLKMGKILPFITPDANPHNKKTLQLAQTLLDDLLKEARNADYSYLSVLVHPQDTVGQLTLSAAGFELMDTTVLYSLDLKNLPKASNTEKNSKVNIRKADEKDLLCLQNIAETCFGNRQYNINRFNSDPNLDQEKVKDLYKQWLYNSLGGRNMADVVFVAEKDNKIAGFVTLQLDPDKKLADIPLNAVNPEYSGLGIYKQMIDHVVDYVSKNNFETLEIWTHATNFAVHKTWRKMGADLRFCAHQYRRFWGD